MLGNIIGDIIGSIYEVKEVEAIKSNSDKNTKLFNEECSYTEMIVF